MPNLCPGRSPVRPRGVLRAECSLLPAAKCERLSPSCGVVSLDTSFLEAHRPLRPLRLRAVRSRFLLKARLRFPPEYLVQYGDLASNAQVGWRGDQAAHGSIVPAH